MEFANTVVVAAPMQEVWDFLQDIEVLAECVPGLQSMEIVEPGSAFSGIASLRFGSSSFDFPARVEWLEREPPQRGRLRALAELGGYQIEGWGQFALQGASEEETQLEWIAGVTPPPELGENPLLASMIRVVGTQFIRTFFDCLQGRLGNIDREGDLC